MGRWLRWVWVAGWCVTLGCYKHHRRENEIADSGGPDVMLFVDGGDDAGPDASDDGSIDGGDGGLIDSGVDAGCSARVPEDFPTLQDAIDLTLCDPILVSQDQDVSTVNVHRSVTITTPDGAQHVIQGDGNGSVFIVPSSVSVTLERLTISGGRMWGGGGINSTGELTLRDVTVSHNEASTDDPSVVAVGGGGLMQMGGSLRMEGDVLFDGNIADGSQALGGALWLATTATFQGHLWLRDNAVRGRAQAHGGAITMFNAALTGERLTLQGNRAQLVDTTDSPAQVWIVGGAIMMSASTLRATEVAIDGNSVDATITTPGDRNVLMRGGAIACSPPGVVDFDRGAATNNVASVSASVPDALLRASGGFLDGSCDVSLDDFTAEANAVSASVTAGGVAQASGGALDLPYGVHRITRSILRSNSVSITVGGSVAAPDSPLAGLPSWAVGGGLSTTDSRLSLVDGLIASNTVFLRLEGTERTVEEVGGGGIALRSASNQNLSGPNSVTIERTSIVENRVSIDGIGAAHASGAGVLVQGRSLFPFPITIESSTIAGNRIRAFDYVDAVARGAAIAIDNDADPPLSLTLSNVTIARNDLDANDISAAAISARSSTAPLAIDVADSIVWGNTLHDATVDDCEGAVLSGGHNITSELACFVGSDLTNRNADPQLQLMTMVSERCQVLPIGTGSPAHNGGSPGMCPAPGGSSSAIDQCGRPRTGACDIGALEAQP